MKRADTSIKKEFYPIPAIIDPGDYICVPVSVPNHPDHIRAFRGALATLEKWWNWERTGDDSGAQTAQVWRDALIALDFLGGCGVTFDVRQNTSAPCTLEKSTDGGTTWEPWASLQKCPPKIRTNNGKLQWFNPVTGLWEDTPDQGDERQNGTYDPPWPTPPAGQSAECLSAENILAVYSSVLSGIRADIIAGKAYVAIGAAASGILGIFIEPALIGTAVLALVGIALDAGTTELATLLNSTSLEKLRCNIYCHANADGSLTASGYTDFYDQLSTDFSGIELTVLQYYFDCLGPVGMNRQAAASGITSADCSACACGGATVTATYGSTINRTHVNVGDTVIMTLGYAPAYGYTYNGGLSFNVPVKANITWNNTSLCYNPCETVWDASNNPTNYATYYTPPNTTFVRGMAGNSCSQATLTFEILEIGS